MAILASQFRESPANPIDVLEELVAANNWAFDRHSESELLVEIAGRWSGYQLYVAWQQEVNAVFLSCQIDLRVPEARRPQVYELLIRVNENLWVGHFDFIFEDGSLMYRHTVPLRGAAGLAVEQIEDLIDAAVVESERLYPAMQFVVWGGQSVSDAITVARMDTVGEA